VPEPLTATVQYRAHRDNTNGISTKFGLIWGNVFTRTPRAVAHDGRYLHRLAWRQSWDTPMVETLTAIRAVMMVAGLSLIAIAGWIDRTRQTAALRPCALFVGVVGTLAILDALAAGNVTSLSIVWLGTFLSIPCIFTWFVIEYYGLPHLASAGRKVAFLAPVALGFAGGSALILTPDVAGSMTGGGPTAPALPSVLGFAALGEQIGLYYAGGVMLAGVALLFRTVSHYDYLDRRLGTVLSFVAVWPWIAYVLTPGIASRVALD